jgi:hypothetical protein
MTAARPAPTPRYWLLIANVPDGPYEGQQIHTKYVAGEIDANTPACPVGDSVWLPLAQFPGLGLVSGIWSVPGRGTPPTAICAVPPGAVGAVLPVAEPVHQTVPAAEPMVLPVPAAEATGKAWNPVAIACLGLLFSPVWAGIMTAMNGRRLGLRLPAWRPIAIAMGAPLLFLVCDTWLGSYLVNALLYLSALGLLWGVDLAWQVSAYRQLVAWSRPTGGWLIPALAGTPLAVVVVLVFVVSPWLPLEPREVCDRFTHATSEPEMQRYTTKQLWPAVHALATLPETGSQEEWELTDEAVAPPELGGYFVGHRVSWMEAGQLQQIEGVFHLVRWEGTWKIEEIYITRVNHQPLETWVALSRDYPLFVPTSSGTAAAPNAAPPHPAVGAGSTARRTQGPVPPGAQPGPNGDTMRFLSRGGGRWILVLLIAVITAVARWGKAMLARFTPVAGDRRGSV